MINIFLDIFIFHLGVQKGQHSFEQSGLLKYFLISNFMFSSIFFIESVNGLSILLVKLRAAL